MCTAQIADDHILDIARNLPEWQIVARKLGFGTQDIADIERNNEKPGARTVFLRKWIEKDGTNATYAKLYKALKEMNEHGAADCVYEILHATRDK